MLTTKISCIMGELFFLFRRKTIPDNPKKILIIRSGALGDVLMSTPFLTALRKRYPESKISYLVGKWSSAILKNNPNIDRIIEFEDKIVYKKNISEVAKLIEKIRKEKFDLCFVLEKSWLFGLFNWLCNIKFSVGFDRRGEGFTYNISVPFDGSKYELEYYLDLERKIGIKVTDKKMRIYCNKKDEIVAEKFLIKNKLKNKLLIGIAPGGAVNPGHNFMAKRWAKTKYLELIERILKMRKNCFIVMFGGLPDKHLLEDLSEINSKRISISPLHSVQISYLLMNKCKLIVTHDSGSMHIAGASNAKVIAIFGPTPSERFAPKNSIVLGVKSKECPCYDIYGNYNKNCREDCMKNTGVKDVFSKIKRTLEI